MSDDHFFNITIMLDVYPFLYFGVHYLSTFTQNENVYLL